MAGSFKYVWNRKKNEANRRKHRLSFDEAKAVFDDPGVLSLFDDSHSSQDETRWITIGRIRDYFVCVVVHTETDENQDVIIRMISARKATPKEEMQYYSHQKEVR